MKEFLRKSAIYALTLFLVTLFTSGLVIKGGLWGYVVTGVLLALLSTVLDPIIKAVTLPFNILTLGLLSFLTTLVSLFILSIFYHSLYLADFTFKGASVLGVSISSLHVSGFLSLVLLSATIYFLNKILSWLFTS